MSLARAFEGAWARHLPYVRLGLHNLKQQKVRSLLTTLGMIFGVAAVIAMLSIGAGTREQVLASIETMGVRNFIVEAIEPESYEQYQKLRQSSPGLTFQDLRLIQSNVATITATSARKRFSPARVLPKPSQGLPAVYGVAPAYVRIAALTVTSGRFFDADEDEAATAVCVLARGAADRLFGARDPIGEHVRLGEPWFRVIGVVAQEDNLVYVPLQAALLRLEDSQSFLRDEIDALYVALARAEDAPAAAAVARGVLSATHRKAPDFRVVVPVELMEEKQRTERLFEAVSIAIATISLLVGGIGIMNIMLASVAARRREIGIRRAVGAGRSDVVRQFLIEAVLLSLAGGLLGILVGVALAWMLASLLGWASVVSATSILVALLVSVAVGLLAGLYPARRAAGLDPLEAIREAYA
jgi:putative ABC transport system permease protein